MLAYRRTIIVVFSVFLLFLFLRRGRGSRATTSIKRLRPSKIPNGQPHDRHPKPPPPPSYKPTYKRPSKDRQRSPLNELSHQPLRQQLAYHFPYEPMSKFPAYIWQTWKTNPASGSFPEQWRPFEASWTELHPDFIHEVLTDGASLHIIRHLYSAIPDVPAAYAALPTAILKADFFRYLILLARGGIYTDIDTAALKSAVEWVPSNVPRTSYGLVIGIEADPDREDWEKWYSRRIQFCQWTIQAKPGHPVLREIVARITEETLRERAKGSLSEFDMNRVLEFTGPAAWTDTVFAFFNDPEYFDIRPDAGGQTQVIDWKQFTGIKTAKRVGDVVVLPITCFSPGVKTMNAGEDDDPMAYVKHIFDGSWKPEMARHIGEKKLPPHR